MTKFDPEATALMVRYLGKGITGRNYRDASAAWDQVWHELRIRGHTRGLEVEALSGIEIALQDCAGKLRRKPLCKLLAGEPSPEVRVFAGSLFASRGPLGRQVDEVKARELAGAKVKIGFGVEEDRRILASVRKAWSEGMLVADANGAYDAATAAKACRTFSNLGPAWFEEPVLSDDWEGYAMLRGSGVKIGGGES